MLAAIADTPLEVLEFALELQLLRRETSSEGVLEDKGHQLPLRVGAEHFV